MLAQVRRYPNLNKKVRRILGLSEFVSTVDEQGARRATRRVVGHPEVRNERRNWIRRVVIHAFGFAPAFGDPHCDLAPVVRKVFDERFGLEKRVPRDGQRPPGVHRHARRDLRPSRGRLGANCDFKESLQEPTVVDAGAVPLVVLGISHD